MGHGVRIIRAHLAGGQGGKRVIAPGGRLAPRANQTSSIFKCFIRA
jgi:hypothetical protein